MRATKAALLLTVALAAACAKKTKPADLPPPPPQTQPVTPENTTPPPADTGPVRSSTAPGSAEDFKANTQGTEIHFGYDSYELDAPARAILDSQSAWLGKYPSTRITVEGHSDERGTREYNLALGERRANAVKTYLSGKGFGSANIATISYGKERPEVEGSNEEAWAQNRRAVTDIGAAGG